MRKNLLNLLRLVPIALLLCAGVASAQSNGVVTGVVTDASTGKPVVGAVIVATSPAVQGEKTAVTGADGSFTISGLPAGDYKFAAQLGSYKPAERAGLVVKADTTLRANLTVVPESVQMEEVVVTGSRVRRIDLTAPAPVMVVNREQLVESGKFSVGEFLQSIPQQDNGLNAQYNNGGDGSFRLDLRGLGTQRTLVLLNGRRMVPGGTGADNAVDLNSIPFAAIDRVEVLANGASSIYGSDAIAGVVNLITKKGYAGTGAIAQYSVSGSGDTQSWDINVNSGVSGDTGSVFFNVGYFNQQELFAGQRDWSNTALSYDYTVPLSEGGGPYPLGSSNIPNGRFTLPNVAVPGETAFATSLRSTFPGRTNFIWQPAGTPNTVCTTVAGAQSCWRAYGRDNGVAVNDSYNFASVNYLVTPMQRISLFTAGDAKLGTDKYAPRFFFEGLYTNRQSSQLLAAVPFLPDQATPPIVISSANYFNPTGIDINTARTRFVALGGRGSSQDLDTFRAVIGLDGKLPDPLKNWVWDTSLNYGRTFGVTTRTGSLITSQLNTALGPSFQDPVTGVLACGTPGNVIAGCQPVNMFGGPNGNPAATLAAISFDGTSRGFTDLITYQLNASGEIFQIPIANRAASLAVGYEFYNTQGGFTPNPIAARYESSEDNAQPTYGGYFTNQVYAEVVVPIASDMFLLNDLEANLAARYSTYSSFGSNFSWQAGARYRPVRDVTLRGTYGTGYRAPSIGELFGGVFENFPAATDPCATLPAPANCGAAAGNGDISTQMKALNGGNPDLKPETSVAWTAGIVFEPTFAKGLTVTADYWSFEVSDSIGSLGASNIINTCYFGGGGYCNLIRRNPANQYISAIDDISLNLGKDATAGIDFAAAYNLPTEVGRFTFGFQATWLNYFDTTYIDGSVQNGAGYYADPASGGLQMHPEWKFTANVGWAWNDIFAGLRTRFISGFTECGTPDGDGNGGLCFQNPNAAQYSRSVSAYNEWDFFASYTLKTSIGKTLFGFGINNIFNAKPPMIYSAFANNTDPAYDFIGTNFFFRVGQSI